MVGHILSNSITVKKFIMNYPMVGQCTYNCPIIGPCMSNCPRVVERPIVGQLKLSDC